MPRSYEVTPTDPRAATGDTAKAGQTQRPTGEKRVSPPPPERQTDEPDNTDRQDQVLTESEKRQRRLSAPLSHGPWSRRRDPAERTVATAAITRAAATVSAMHRLASLLAAYDEELRTDAETPGALVVTRLGPLRLVTFPGGRGFVTYRDLGGADREAIQDLVRDALEHYGQDPSICGVEWKTRGHDDAPGLHDALLSNGFTPEEPESIMIGEARALAVDVPTPAGVQLRRVATEADVRAMCAMQGAVFDDPDADEIADAVLRRLTSGDGMELWVAETEAQIIGAGRLEPVRGSRFAGIWGGATTPEWRGQGVYRALTAVRAGAALRAGKTLIHSDSTECSRPILERAGLVRVSTTTPYQWRP